MLQRKGVQVINDLKTRLSIEPINGGYISEKVKLEIWIVAPFPKQRNCPFAVDDHNVVAHFNFSCEQLGAVMLFQVLDHARVKSPPTTDDLEQPDLPTYSGAIA